MSAMFDLHTDLSDVHDTFKFFDADQDRRLNVTELMDAMVTLGQRFEEDELLALMGEVAPGSDSVNFSQFLALMSMPVKAGDLDEEVLEAFKIVDSDGDGFITQDDLNEGLRDLGEDVTQDDLARMIDSADAQGTGNVNYDDFLDMIGYKCS